jgi:hypothetical protein
MHSILHAKFSSDSYGHSGVPVLVIECSGSEAAEVLKTAIFGAFFNVLRVTI